MLEEAFTHVTEVSQKTNTKHQTYFALHHVHFLPVGLGWSAPITAKILNFGFSITSTRLQSCKGSRNCKKINYFYRRSHFWSGLLTKLLKPTWILTEKQQGKRLW